ncbi:LysR substrate-binding domain-containing protein [Aquamicrobium zhengzhouense]|uniref:LysR family transcriptional regulator n=1 Tax=Aquamicrobium zhengzhouense TaxID=2781738 RepID=A0ABS0SF68_9HYPH|nr:LysR substrate-binding domain-containing protein [Aquamicrobium zhengzhouense]MBI1621933.1 LysR family transcriptional regulator [Aquamicrobium zhengzhouense]
MSHDLNDMRLFVQVAEAGGFAKASRQTGVPRATLSRRIAALEEAMGLRLIERSSRTFRLTGAGDAFFTRAKPAVDLADDAFACGSDVLGEPVGTVRFAAPQSLLQLGLGKMVQRYLADHPRVSIQIEATNRRVDLLREGFDFAIRARESSSAPLDQVIVPFVEVEHVLAVAPSWRKEAGTTVASLIENVPVLAWAAAGEPAMWRLENGDGNLQRIVLKPRLTVEDMALLKDAAIAGLGVALLPRIMVKNELAAGTLVELKLDLKVPRGRLHAIHLGRKGMRPAVSHLLTWLKQEYRWRFG